MGILDMFNPKNWFELLTYNPNKDLDVSEKEGIWYHKSWGSGSISRRFNLLALEVSLISKEELEYLLGFLEDMAGALRVAEITGFTLGTKYTRKFIRLDTEDLGWIKEELGKRFKTLSIKNLLVCIDEPDIPEPVNSLEQN